MRAHIGRTLSYARVYTREQISELEVRNLELEIMNITDMHTCIRLKKCIQTDGPTTRRVDGRTIGRTNRNHTNR